METSHPPTSEQLMAEMAWVRRLARALVRDDATADDVAQDTFLVATAQQPAEDRPLRPWLARVVRNLVRTRRRGDLRRDERGAAFDGDRVVPTPAELVERVELQRAVADEVLALAEPYRSTVLLHFFEGLASAEIARRLGIPDGTVRRRLKVALDQLREAMRTRTDAPREHGGWLAALVPLARGSSPPTTMIGALVMKKAIAIGLALLLLLLFAFGVWKWRGGGSSRGDEAAPASVAGGGSATPLARPGGADDDLAAIAIPAWLARPDLPARRIAGRVVAHGQPVGGARVLLGLVVTGEPSPVDSPAPVQLLQPVATTTSAADGTFDFGPQPPLVFTVSASATDRAPVAVQVANSDPRAAPDHLVLALGACTARMSGTIADASGGPIAKARVSVAGLSGTESDASGHYSVCLFAPPRSGPAWAFVRVEADHYGSENHYLLAGSIVHRDFALVPEATLVGKVTTRDGHPVAGARVIAMISPTEIRMHGASNWATSDKDGAFRIANLAPGAFELIASAPGLATASPVPAFARPAASSAELRIVVVPRARLRGRVVMAGAPVVGETVTAVLASGEPHGSAISGADGSFVLDDLPDEGTITFVLARHDLAASPHVRIDAPPADGVTLEAVARAALRGRVTRHGQPVAGATILYMEAPQLTALGPPEQGISDASGAYLIEGVRPGPIRVFAYDSATSSFADWQPVEVAAGETKTVDIALDRAGAVQGTVVDQGGKPVAGVDVFFQLANGDDDICDALTDAAGHFDCTMLVGGDYRARVSPAWGITGGFAPASGGDGFPLVHVPPDDTVKDVTLAIADERFAIAGRVVDDLGAAVPDVRIEAIGNGGGVSMDLPGAATDGTGHFEIGNLARGTYNVHAHAADGGDCEVLAIAAGTKTVVIELARAGAIEGTLEGFTTPPRVLTTSLTPDLRMGGWATVDGATFSQRGLPPGRYTVDAKAGAEVDGQTVDVKPGETAHVALRSRGVGTVRGTVTELASHAPVAGFRCDAILSMDGQMSGSPPEPALQTYTDATGHFTASAPLGHVRIFCFAPNRGSLSAAGLDLDVAPGVTATATAFAVRSTSGNAPGDAGFLLDPMRLPITVTQVLPGGSAATAGLIAGDRIVAIDGTALSGVLAEGAMMLVANHKPGTTVTLGIERAGAVRTLEIKVGGSPPPPK